MPITARISMTDSDDASMSTSGSPTAMTLPLASTADRDDVQVVIEWL